MKTRVLLFAACVLTASVAFAQSPSPVPGPKARLLPPATLPSPGDTSAPPAVPFTPQPPRQALNVKVDLLITEDGGTAPPLRKNITAVIGDGFNGSVREQATSRPFPLAGSTNTFDSVVAPLNLDASPRILANGKIQLGCTIQYVSRGPTTDERRMTTDIKQNLSLILESGKPLVVSQATDPVSDRRVTVEVTATILK